MKSPVEIGTKAPDFVLPGTTQDSVKLSDQLGKGPVLLLFYPLDWSPVCTSEMCSIRDGFTEFERLGVTVLGISVDSIFSHKAFAEKLGIAFPLLSDFNKEVCTAYGVIHEEILGLRGIAKRSVFLLDGTGVVRYGWVSDDPGTMPDLADVKAACDRLKNQ